MNEYFSPNQQQADWGGVREGLDAERKQGWGISRYDGETWQAVECSRRNCALR
jgi:hypothetical protein